MSRVDQSWYGAVLLFEIRLNGRVQRHEGQVVAVRASSEEEARQRASAYGEREAISYDAIGGAAVWKLVDVLAVAEVPSEEIDDRGWEVYSWSMRDVGVIETAKRILKSLH